MEYEESDRDAKEEDHFLSSTSEDDSFEGVTQLKTRQATTTKLKRFKSIPYISYALIFVASSTNTVTGILTRDLSDVDPLVIVSIRAAIIFLISSLSLFFRKITPFPERKLLLLFIRALLLVTFTTAVFFGYRHLPFGDVRTITATQVVFVGLFAQCFLSEPCGASEVQMVILTVIGVIMVTNPPFLFGGDHGGNVIYDRIYYLAASFSAVAAVVQAANFVLIRSLKDLDFNVVAAWGGITGAILPMVAALIIDKSALSPVPNHVGTIVLIGLLSYLSQASMILALQVEGANLCTVLRRAVDILLGFCVQVPTRTQSICATAHP